MKLDLTEIQGEPVTVQSEQGGYSLVKLKDEVVRVPNRFVKHDLGCPGCGTNPHPVTQYETVECLKCGRTFVVHPRLGSGRLSEEVQEQVATLLLKSLRPVELDILLCDLHQRGMVDLVNMILDRAPKSIQETWDFQT